jgi:glycerophosphoryl diester phosphodiesterase
MTHHLKQNFNLRALRLFIVVLFLLIISSCCKEGDCKCPKENEIDYTEFFIAHAGGAIESVIYTNSLEALDLSYSKGCKLFELDLNETTDGKIVATHDEIIITEAEFMVKPIAGKYTPMNMEAINRWFQTHPGAILITDKINDPQRIYDEFQFRDRVIMELFSWSAVDKAIELGIKPMPSENLIFGSSTKAIAMGILPQPTPRNSDIEQILKEKKIEYISIGFYAMQNNKKFFRELKEKGIKCYVWTPRNKEKKEWIYDMDFCYGMYADNLDLLAFLLNGTPTKRK